MTTLGQGPLVPIEEKLIKDALVALITEHGPDAVRWVWRKLKSEDPRLKTTAKGSGGALVALAAVALATKKRRRR